MRRVILIAGLLALAACQKGGSSAATDAPQPQAQPQPEPQPDPGPRAASLLVTDDSGHAGPFAMTSLTRLVIDASFEIAPGPHSVRVDVVRPDGGVHGTIRGKVDVGSDGAATLRQFLEVAGSTIEQYHVVGTWHFALSVDDGPRLVAASVDIRD
jgi:hypothetical protein